MNRKLLILGLLVILIIIAFIVIKGINKMPEIKVTSPAFEEGKEIPSKYTCNGENINPTLNFSGIPEETKTLVLIMDDPDAPSGTWTHWVVWNIPIVNSISENSIPGIQGRNSWDKNSYGGPCPPSGTHRYFFRIYALDTNLEDLPESATAQEVMQEIKDNILAQGQLMGVVTKK